MTLTTQSYSPRSFPREFSSYGFFRQSLKTMNEIQRTRCIAHRREDKCWWLAWLFLHHAGLERMSGSTINAVMPDYSDSKSVDNVGVGELD